MKPKTECQTEVGDLSGPPRLRISARDSLRVAAFEPRSLVNGPGVRAVLWVQGCGRRCPGCFNPDFLSREGGRWVAVSEVVRWIEDAGRSASGPIEGVTFSGGEPFDQAEALAAVARSVREQGLGVMVFTGHPWADLREGGRAGWAELVAASDLLVAGPYQRETPGAHPLLASGNQELVHVSTRYPEAVSGGVRRRVEFRIGADGDARVTGFPSGNLRGRGELGTEPASVHIPPVVRPGPGCRMEMQIPDRNP